MFIWLEVSNNDNPKSEQFVVDTGKLSSQEASRVQWIISDPHHLIKYNYLIIINVGRMDQKKLANDSFETTQFKINAS